MLIVWEAWVLNWYACAFLGGEVGCLGFLLTFGVWEWEG